METLSERVVDLVGAAGHHASAKSGFTDALGWLRVHLLNAAAITAMATVVAAAAAVIVPFWLRALDRRPRPEGVEPSRRDRAKVLQRIHNWITRRPELLPAEAVLVDLAFRRRPDLATSQNEAPFRSPKPTVIERGKAISQIFEDTGASLLIVGPPGSGKTTLLLRLGRELLDRASKADSEEPIPIVADLTSWAIQPQPLAAWLAKEIAGRRHKISSDAFGYWLARNGVVLLLDGLDEVDASQRDACVQAINAFRGEYGLTGIAVCCGAIEAAKLPTMLDLDEAIQLELPTDSAVDKYLRDLEAAGTPAADIRSAIEADDDLRDLLRAPLMLQVVTRACRDLPVTALQKPGSSEERLNQLWDGYVASMFQRRPTKRSARAQRQEIHWLEWLASALRDRNQTEFRLDRLSTDWLPPRARKFMELYIVLAVILGGTIGRSLPGDVYWSWMKLRSRFYSRPFVGVVVMYLVIMVGTGYWMVTAGRNSHAVVPYWGTGLSFGVLTLTNLGWERDREDAWTAPHEGIRHAAINGLVVGLPAGATLGVVLGIADAWNPDFKAVGPLIVGIIAALIGFLVMGLWAGFGFCVAYFLFRVLLARSGRAPWRYRRFLDAMSDRQLMRSSGGSYLFAHRLLRDHLADRAGRHMSQALTPTG